MIAPPGGAGVQGEVVGCRVGDVQGEVQVGSCTVARFEVTNGNMEVDSWPS